MIVARIARDGHDRGLTPPQILAEVEKVTGPAPERPDMNPAFRNPDITPDDLRRSALQLIAFHFALPRRHDKQVDEARMVYSIMQWSETVLPHFRRG